MTARIVVLDGTRASLLERLHDVRSQGDIPLVGDQRWPQEHWTAVRALAAAKAVPEEAAWATLTSGTSGTPRIVLRSHASWQQSFAAIATILTGPVLLPAPPASSLTLFSLAHALNGGPQPVDNDEATCFHGTPQALRTVLESSAYPRLRTALVGGSHLDPQLRAAAQARGIRVVSYYGAAELSFVALDQGTGLRAFPGAELGVRRGELWVRSPYTALGYLGTAGPLRRDGDWSTVGDRANLDDGVLTLQGRADSAILTASATVVPEDVEATLRTIAGVRDAVVFGFPAPGVGAIVAAMVEPLGAPLTVGELRTTVAAHCGPAHRPRLWFTGSLPRTASGKPARAEVRRQALSGKVERLA
ncbi:class I adenylate-forming enzyme family protein [Kineosporia babensis]|uniref:Acyl--CoA ligase n=1 Tax=Kineosporia babensis TaxID=499548 RepID=A0A9X1SXA7_9ACTN|nr:class I adenylate-forming enzyme family protein [Kineosporia babensis]MCD5314980.1 acyl--CoA ligase [Kineosporia babensis]